MKTKVVIQNGDTEIVLTPENEFEKDILEKVYSKKERFTIQTVVDARYTYGSYDNHKVTISLKESIQ